MINMFLRVVVFLFFTLLFQFNSYATHVIGGELQLIWTGNANFYTVRLNMYENEKSVNYYHLDLQTTQTVYFTTSVVPSSNYTYINQLDLPLVANGPIATNNNFCATNNIVQTNLLVYQKVVDLSGMLGSYGSQTFYITWQYCCRNEDITNISSPSNTEMALYTRCPPLSYRNNSPAFVPLKNEYFCRNTFNSYNMSATDVEGDQLRYKIVPPLQAIDPNYSTAEVNWNSGYSGTNPIPGEVPLTIDPNTGVLTFKTSRTGVFSFSILVEEYRGGVKIGEVKKDYQFNVQPCVINNKPVIDFKDTALHSGAEIEISPKGLCIPLYITDIDASQFALTEVINVNTVSDFPASNFNLTNQVTADANNDTIFPSLCINPCLLQLDKTATFSFHIVINDLRCPAQYDTLDFTIKIIQPENAVPTAFIAPLIDPQLVKVDSLVTFGVFGTDADPMDSLSLTIVNRQRGMIFQNVFDSTSTISSTFKWSPNCNDLNPGTYDVYFIVTDNSCIYGHADTVYQRIVVIDNEVSFASMEITNLVTPNGDGLNDFYHIPGIPTGNCSKYFKGIEVYNRWGARVYYSQDRFFYWAPEVSDGIYYYSIDLNDEVKKGWIQVTR